LKVISVIQGIRLSQLLKLVIRNGITPLPLYLIRFLVLLQGALVSSVLIPVEAVKYWKHIRACQLKGDPVFIIGHWRTGSTFLHQLMNLDPQFTAPTMVQTIIPEHFLFSSRYYIPILRRLMPSKRPMDNVHLDPQSPQEEEFALIRMGAVSPLEKLLFPRGKDYFLKAYGDYIPRGKNQDRWKRKLDWFYKKITYETGQRILSKNPYHTPRIRLLSAMYPSARFILIERDPRVVVPSTIRMWNVVARENKLRHRWHEPTVEEVSRVLKSFLDTVEQERTQLAPNHFSSVDFEELEKDPPAELRRIYAELGLDFSEKFAQDLLEYMDNQEAYRKNHYALSEAEEELILSIMGEARA
jgi:hypothetical protein